MWLDERVLVRVEEKPILDAIIREHERIIDQQKTYLQYSKDYGLHTIRTIVILNSGALLAAVNLAATMASHTGNQQTLREIGTSAIWFLAGIISGVVSSACGYFNFMFNNQALPSASELRNYEINGDVSGWRERKFLYRGIDWTMYLAIIAVLASIICLAIGVEKVAASLGN